jgi:hypothetical protein
MRKLRILMWKQMLLRKNRWILSLIELLLPILIVWSLSKNAEDFIKAKGSAIKNATVYPPFTVKDVVRTRNSFKCIVYAPNKPPLKDLMNQYRKFFEGKTNLVALMNLSEMKFCFNS